MLPASSSLAPAGDSFRKLIESLLKVPYRTLRETKPRKAPPRAGEKNGEPQDG